MFSPFYYSSLVGQPIGCAPLYCGLFPGFINCSLFRTKLAQKGRAPTKSEADRLYTSIIWSISWFYNMFSPFYYSSLVRQPIGCAPLYCGLFPGFVICSPFRTKLAQKGRAPTKSEAERLRNFTIWFDKWYSSYLFSHFIENLLTKTFKNIRQSHFQILFVNNYNLPYPRDQ